MFNRAIVRTPAKSMIDGITTADLGRPDYLNALEQHKDYVNALKECGLDVLILEAEEQYPDSVFVEDVALMTPACAILTRPGALSRTGEVHSMLPILEKYYQNIERITAEEPSNATVEAGDIMMVGQHFYIGLSERTNRAGADQMTRLLEQYSMTASVVTMSEVLHLKTGLSYIENNNLLVCGEFISRSEFKDFNHLVVAPDEAYATNSVWINDTVLVPAGFPKTLELIQSAGYKTRTVDVSEFEKIDGGLSCLSLRSQM